MGLPAEEWTTDANTGRVICSAIAYTATTRLTAPEKRRELLRERRFRLGRAIQPQTRP